MNRNIIAEGNGLFTIDRIRIGTGNVDGAPYFMDPAHIVQKTCPVIRNGIIAGAVRPGSCRQSGQRILIHNVRGSVRQHVRNPNEGDSILDGHVLTVDIVRPHITYALLALQIIFGDVLHGDRGVLKMFYLPLRCNLAGMVGIKNHKDQQCSHNEYIDNSDPGFFHSTFHSPADSFSYISGICSQRSTCGQVLCRGEALTKSLAPVPRLPVLN